MSIYPYLAKASLGLGVVFALIHPAFAQIVPNGAGTVATPQGNQINITGGTQAGGNLFHSFRDFNVNSSQVANFLSNPQIQNILARVNGGNPSMINGLLQITGGNSNLFLMNPAGIVFGQGASLNIPASFTATTANQIGFGNNLFNAFGDNNFSALTGNPDSFVFTTNQAGSIVNAGNLSVTSGQGINLIGGNIVNTGNINAGNITLAAVPGTNRVRISQPGHILSLEIVPPVDAVITPLDLPWLLTGSGLPGISSNGSTVQVAGVEIPAGQGINITSGNLGNFSQGGVINVLGDRVALVNANLNTSGSNGGGTIRVGGEYRGGGVNPFNSRITYVDAGSFLNADAINSGNGGRVIVWADDTTRFYGNISARGGANSGNGGFAEVSGAQNLTFAGNADLSAPRGNIGTLLLDPTNIEIRNGAGVGTDDATLPDVLEPGDTGAPFVIYERTLELLGAGAEIILQASNNITIQNLADDELILGRSINFLADSDNNGVGNFLMNAGDRIATSGQNITITAANILGGDIDASTIVPNQNGGSVTLTATRGDIRVGSVSGGAGIAAGNAGTGGNIRISAPNGNFVSTGDVDSRSVVDGTGNSSEAGTIDITARSIDVGGIIAAYSRVDTGTSGNGGNITIRATNGSVTASGMTTATAAAITGVLTLGNAGDITIDAANNVTLSGAIISEVSPDRISFDTRSEARGGGNAGTGGNIRINQNFGGNGNFLANGEINSFSSTLVLGSNSADAGDIRISARNINTRDINNNIVNSSSQAISTGNGGVIALSSQGNLSTGDIFSMDGRAITLSSQGNLSTGDIRFNSSYGNGRAITLSSQGNLSTGDITSLSSFGNGGVIALSSQRSLSTGRIWASSSNGYDGMEIALSSQGNLSTGDIESGTDFGNGGAIRLSSQSNLSTGNIFSGTGSGNGGSGSGNGGAIALSSQGNLSTGNIRSYSSTGNGGVIALSSQGNLSTDNIRSDSFSGNGGAITLSSQGNLSTGNIASRSDANIRENVVIPGKGSLFPDISSIPRGSGSGNGGAIALSSQGNLSTGDINSGTGSGNGGAIALSSQGNLSTGDIFSQRGYGSGSGYGGAISLSSQGNLSTGDISSQNSSGSGYGGNVSINTGSLFLATGSITARDGTTATISTQGGAGGGSITITHGGSTSVPFLVGNATNNGTQYAITSGTGSNTINNLTVPVPPAINNYGTNISIRTTAPESPILPPQLPIRPESVIDSSIFEILTNPASPPTPDPVIVGTPPILVVEPIPATPLINLPVNTPSTEQITIAPPVINNPVVPPIINNPPLVVPPPSPTNPQLSRPILDPTSPGVQSPISLTTNDSSIPIIDRLPINNLNDKIRLLDDPFKEEFQAFTGLADEIATLDVNQAQDILNRITRQTNAKPALIYVFFSPANDTAATNRSVSSARSQLFRNPSNTDTLEIVLVPPTGDLVRVKYPALTRPEVLESAGELTRGVARRSIYGKGSRRMYDLIVAPLEEDLKRLKIDNLVFLLDRGLRSMPIAAMQNKNNQFIIENYSVALMPSLTLTDTTYSPLQDAQVMAMGADRFVVDGLVPLPGVPVELKAINQIRGGNIFFNENFTLSNLRQNRSPNQRIVHLATHGSFLGDKTNSFIQLWGTERLTIDQIRTNGFGTPPVDLLVLSACETALGNTDAELGFAGLAVTSGVRSALASLWQVSDEGTMGLMAEFYQQLQTTTTKSEALRQAQLAMLRGEVRLEGGSLVTPKGNFTLNEELQKLGDRKLQHPFFWSAFTMIGNPW